MCSELGVLGCAVPSAKPGRKLGAANNPAKSELQPAEASEMGSGPSMAGGKYENDSTSKYILVWGSGLKEVAKT